MIIFRIFAKKIKSVNTVYDKGRSSQATTLEKRQGIRPKLYR
jgi:hypothetical protein